MFSLNIVLYGTRNSTASTTILFGLLKFCVLGETNTVQKFNTLPTIYRRVNILNLCTDFMTNLLVTGTPVFSRALFSFPPALVHRMELSSPWSV